MELQFQVQDVGAVELVRPDGGEVAVFGGPMDEDKKNRIGYMPEERGLYKDLKLEPTLVFMATLKGLSESVTRQRVGAWLERLDLAGRQVPILRALDKLAKIAEVYRLYGFDPLESSGVETVEALGKFLPDVDRPNEGVFAWQEDGDGDWLALRYDLTAPLARVYAQHRNDLPTPYRRYAMGPVWRNEKPGPGRRLTSSAASMAA